MADDRQGVRFACSREPATAAVWLLALALTGLAAAQEPPDFDADWRWVDFGREDGLPGGHVREVIEADGVVWVWSEGGVAFYDGFIWTPVEIAPGLGPRSVTSLALGPGRRPVLVAADRLFEHDGRAFVEVDLSSLEPGQTVQRAVAHPEGGFALATRSAPAGRRLYHLGGRGAQRIDAGRALTSTNALWSTGAGRLWTAFSDGVAVLEDGAWQDRHPGIGLPAQVLESRAGVVYVARNDLLRREGLTRIDADGSVTPLPEEGGHRLWAADLTADGRLGVFLYDTGDVRVLTDGVFSDLKSPNVRWANASFVRFGGPALTQDLWLGSPDRLSLYRRSLDRWRATRRPFPSQRNRVNALLVDRRGTLWQATAGGVGYHVPPDSVDPSDSVEWQTEILGRSIVPTTALAEDADGAIWIGSGVSFFGALRYQGGEWTAIGAEQGLTGGRVHRIVAGRDGALWFATLGESPRQGAGVYRRRGDGTVEAWSRDIGLVDLAAFDVLDLGDEVWVAGESGVLRLRDGRLTEWSAGLESALGFPGAFALARDAHGRTWFSGHPEGPGGLGYVDVDDRLVWADPPGGYGGQRVWSLTVDPAGSLWAGSAAGLLRYHQDRWSLFGAETGLTAQGVWPVVVDDSQIVVGTLGSGVRILRRGEEQNPPPRLWVVPPLVDGRAVHVRWRAASYFGSVSAQRIETRHRVDGGPWSPWSLHRELTLTGVGSGEHRIHVEAKGLFGQVADEPTTVRAIVPLPLLLRPAFAAPVALLLAALLTLGSYTYHRRQVEERTRRLDVQRLRTLIESAPEAIGIFDARAERFIELNSNASQMFGRSREELLAIDPMELMPATLPDGRATRSAVEAEIARALAGESVKVDWEVLGAPDRAGSPVPIPCEVRIHRLPAVDEVLLRVSVLDVREQVRAAHERAALEERLRQGQKLEALGKLTGGIAHDFNNLLTVILGTLDLLAEDENLGDNRRLVDNARSSANQGADLIRRLLTFSRHQPLAARRVDLATLLPELYKLLERTLPETIRVELSVAPELPPVTVDPTGFENAVLNLAINSRDAMPDGGTLTLAAAPAFLTTVLHEDVEPGPCVAVTVSDDGCGMPRQVLERAFDPFFTTKEAGSGTGLGLSMVYGFARQSGGAVQIDSELGRGTTVRLYLPLATTAADWPRDRPDRSRAVPGRGERLLVVEDDESVRGILVLMLEDLGYRVDAVNDVHQALERLRSDQPFDLVLSDVVLPGGMTGPELGRIAAGLRPDLPFLFASGYAGGSLPDRDDDAPIDLLLKPFERGELSRRIRARLAPGEPPPGPADVPPDRLRPVDSKGATGP